MSTATETDENVDALLQDMQSHLSSKEEQDRTCAALRKCAAKPDDKKRILASGGISILIQVMTLHNQASSIQESACGTLKNLCSSPEGERSVAFHGGIEAVIRAMEEHRVSAGVQEQALGALKNLSFQEENKITILALGGLGHVVSTMEQHVGVKGVQEHAFGVLKNLCQSEERVVTRKLAEIGGVEAVQAAIMKHMMSPVIVSLGCWLWWEFKAFDNFCYAKTEALGGGDIALKCMGKPFYKPPYATPRADPP
eukprot:gnl/TRDRNA2_/TRDRNA2_83365_c0_seq1.p1 gnl/TRDRNA2_/TRDRNA2_83365_c0~~gnl/TRDRNA2_/TRDRNA2_83365_c0_seq1.p1  ORF type:complete len:254 (-),score=48.55 gnl/TRDRNA2_/TRDRNA2_83365_c0_seq1:62-823(-)